ncbi:MAG: hypothetical protein ACUVT9_06330 [Candidatus Bathycorpusculaceae bacterium]
MKIRKNAILAVSLAFLMTLPTVAALSPIANAEAADDVQSLQVNPPYIWNNTWYRFDSPLITLIFPAGGRKPMFLWWYTNDNNTIYVVKFKGVIEYLIVDKQYYLKRFHADHSTIGEALWQNYIEPRLRLRWGFGGLRYNQSVNEFGGLLPGLHTAYLPFSACDWALSGPELVEDGGSSYWSFNFTLTEVYGHLNFKKFVEGNIQIRCRFYNTTTPEVLDEEHSYTVAAGQLKFDFVVNHWEWNIDKINQFLARYDVEIPVNRSGLALWVNMASINIQNLTTAENEVQYEAQNHVEAEFQVENGSNMQNTMVGDEYAIVSRNETSQDEKPVQATLQLRERFRERIRAYFACGKTNVSVGFFEFVPWARLLNETGGTVEFVNVTASYVAAGGHLRLFICYPYFGNYTLEHDPTIGLASAPIIPELVTPRLLIVLVGATIAIAIAVAVVRMRKKPVNIVKVY